MSELFIKILNMSITASYVIIFIIFVRLLLKRSPKIISYALWSIVAFRLITSFSFDSVFSLLPRNINTVPIPYDIINQQSPKINSGIEVLDSFISQSLPAATTGTSVNPLQLYIKIGSYIWILGIIILILYSFASIFILKRRLRNAQLIENNIYEADNLKTPFVIGFIVPKIYLPIGLNSEERRYILLHEQIHIYRKDHIIKLLAFLVLSVHWFNPLVWIAFMLMSIDMELSCDERVLKEMNENIKKSYANSLLSLASERHILNGSPLAFGEGNVKRRIKNVINYKKPKFWVVLVSVIILIVASISLLSNPNQSADSLFPPRENQEVVLEALQVIYLKDASTNYSLGDIGSEFSLTEDKLVVKGEEEIETFEISYVKTNITLDELKEEVQMGKDFPDKSSYKSIVRYDLCKSTKDLPGYRLYVLDDDTYWMATLYNNNVWRVMSMDDSYWSKK